MPILFSIKEHKNYAAFTPKYTFSKSAASVLRATSTPPALGRAYFFITLNRAWLNGKYLRFRWRSILLESTLTCHVYIYDGAYDRSSDVDFPSGSPFPAKGNGLLQTVASKLAAWGWETLDVLVDSSGGSETDCTIFFRIHDNQAGFTGSIDLDWFEINNAVGGVGNLYNEQFTDSITMELSGTVRDYGYISTGVVIPTEIIELAASFEVGQNSANLPAKFESGQGFSDLAAEFIVKAADSQDLTAGFIIRSPGSQDLAARMSVLWIGDLKAKFRVEKIYDLRGTAGIAFYWWGANNPPSAMNQLILETPTGFWFSDFYDGPAKLRHVFIPWGNFTWVSAAQRYLEPHRHGFEEPDKSRITGFLITIHTTGKRKIDYIYAPIMEEFFAKFVIRRSTSANLSAAFNVWHSTSHDFAAEYIVRRSASQDLAAGFDVGQGARGLAASFDAQVSLNLPAEFVARGDARQELLGEFIVRQGAENLASKFTIRQDVMNLPAKMGVIGTETEDFEDETLVDHYQHYSGPGYRNAIFPHTGSWSWRTPQDQVDVFDISNGRPLSYAKVTVWAFAGNVTRKIELLDSDFNTLVQTTWTVDGYIQKSVEFTGAVKYLRITCPAGANSGLWTDDIEIRWAT